MLRAILLLLISFPVYAIEDGKVWEEKESANFCLDPQNAISNEKLAKEHPNDELLVKIVALRAGLCDLISKEIIDLDFAIDVFNHEYDRTIMKRLEEEQTSNKKKGA